MHYITSSAPSLLFIWMDFSSFFFFFPVLHGNPLPSITLGAPAWRNKPAVLCGLSRLRGGGDHFPSSLAPGHIVPSPPHTPPPFPSKQKLMWGIQLVNLTRDTLPAQTRHSFTDPLITSCRRRGEKVRAAANGGY